MRSAKEHASFIDETIDTFEREIHTDITYLDYPVLLGGRD